MNCRLRHVKGPEADGENEGKPQNAMKHAAGQSFP